MWLKNCRILNNMKHSDECSTKKDKNIQKLHCTNLSLKVITNRAIAQICWEFQMDNDSLR